MRSFLVRLRRSPAKWGFPLVAGFEVWIVGELRSSGFPLWSEVGAALMYSVLIVGPVAASFAGLRAWVEQRPALRELDTGMARHPMIRRWVAASGDIGWVALAYVAGAGYLFAVVGPTATWGGPDWLHIAAGFLAVWACGFIGWAVGWLLPSRVTGPLVGLALYTVMGVLQAIDVNVRAPWIPSNLERLSPFELVAPGLLPAQIVIFGGFIVAGVAASALGASARRTGVGLFVGLAMLVVGLIVAPQGLPAVAVGDPPQVCDPGDIVVCYHPAYAAGAGSVIDAVRETISPLVMAGVVPPRLVQSEYDEAVISVPFPMNPEPTNAAQALAEAALGGGTSCEDDDDFADHYLVRKVVTSWLVSQAVTPAGQSSRDETGQERGGNVFFDPGDQAVYERFASMPGDERIAWLADNFDRLRSCDLDTEDLP